MARSVLVLLAVGLALPMVAFAMVMLAGVGRWAPVGSVPVVAKLSVVERWSVHLGAWAAVHGRATLVLLAKRGEGALRDLGARGWKVVRWAVQLGWAGVVACVQDVREYMQDPGQVPSLGSPAPTRARL